MSNNRNIKFNEKTLSSSLFGGIIKNSKESKHDLKEKNDNMSILLGKSIKKGGHGHFNDNTKTSHHNDRSLNKNYDDSDENKYIKIVDKIITANGSDIKKLRKFGKNVQIENEKSEQNLFKRVDNYVRNILNENFASKENNTNNYELVEKPFLDKLISENKDLTLNIKNLQEKLFDIKKFNFKTVSEENFLKHAVNTNIKFNQHVIDKKQLADDIKKSKQLNKNLKIILSNEKIQNDNLNQAIKTLFSEISNEIKNEFDELLNKYDNFYYLDKKKFINDNKTIEDLLGIVDQLEKEKFSKEIEIKNLKNSRPDKADLFRK